MKASLVLSLFLLLSLFPNSAWSAGTDCVDCGNALSGTPDLGPLERLKSQIDCSFFESSICMIWDEVRSVDEFHHFVNYCGNPKTTMQILRDVSCNSRSRSRDYQKQYLLHLLISERGTFSTVFNDLARHFRNSGKASEFGELLNVVDSQGLAFLDYLEETATPGANQTFSSTLQAEYDRTRRTACLFGARYAKRSQPSDCARSANL
jgi:hypothetical protein